MSCAKEAAIAPTKESSLPYKRILLKLSGEALMGELSYGWDSKTVQHIAQDICQVHNQGVQLCLVIGGGNIFRGIMGDALGIDRCTADYMGMLATVMNALAVKSELEHLGITARVMSALSMKNVCETYVRDKALRHLEKGRVVIFAAGTGNPYFTTDSAGALRACEMECDLLAKGTKVEGVYSADPKKNQDAQYYPDLSYEKVLKNNLKVMDTTAISLARDNNMPILVFSIQKPGNFIKALQGEALASYIHGEET